MTPLTTPAAPTHEVYVHGTAAGTHKAVCRVCVGAGRFTTKPGTKEGVTTKIEAHVTEVHHLAPLAVA